MSSDRRPSTLAHLLPEMARKYPDKTAVIVQEQSIRFHELEELSSRVSGALQREGLAPGDRVAVLGKESVELIALLFGAAKAGGVWVPVNYRLSPPEVAQILADAAPRLLFVDFESLPLLKKTLSALPSPTFKIVVLGASTTEGLPFSEWIHETKAVPSPREVCTTEAVVQLYTSGTTGRPKGIRLAHRTFFAIADEMAARGDKWIGWSDQSVSLLFVPTFHIGGLWWLVRGLALGCTNIVLRAFEPRTVLSSIARYQVNKTCMVPAMMQILMSEPSFRSTDLSSLETIVYGGSPISEGLLLRAMEGFGCDFCQIYGLSETGNMAVCLRPEDHRGASMQRLRAAGRPLPGVQLRILDSAGGEVAPGQTGQIALRTPARMMEYWNNPEATRQTLTDGWILTGDAGRLDSEGFLHVCDRMKDMIISAGENIYPAEIENALRSHPDVSDVAVIGVPDDLWGEAVKAVVVRRPGSRLEAQDVIQHARASLAEFKVPKTVALVELLPRNASGKVLKTQLREPHWKGRERGVN